MLQLPSARNVFEPSGVADPAWREIGALRVEAIPTPQSGQSSRYLQKTYEDRNWGAIEAVALSGWQTRKKLTILAEWEAEAPTSNFNGPDSFLDRLAILFPKTEDTPLGNMGSEDAPATIWTWRTDNRLEKLTAKGPGSIAAITNAGLRADAAHIYGKWRVQITGVRPEGPRQFSVALWKGSAKERAGLKSFVPDWIDLTDFAR